LASLQLLHTRLADHYRNILQTKNNKHYGKSEKGKKRRKRKEHIIVLISFSSRVKLGRSKTSILATNSYLLSLLQASLDLYLQHKNPKLLVESRTMQIIIIWSFFLEDFNDKSLKQTENNISNK